MTKNTKIEWAHHTFNPWLGCTKVGPGCDHCYAESWAKRSGLVQWGPKAPRRRTSVSNWNQPLKWDRMAAAAGIRYRVFCASLADVFDNEVSYGWRTDLFALIRQTPNLDWLLLTKRIGNARDMLPTSWGNGDQNVWLGATVVTQEEADRDVPKLLSVPARIRFLSIEPMMGPIDLMRAHFGTVDSIDWVIAGGESGAHARPSNPDWFRSLRDQCLCFHVPFHFKQYGEWGPELKDYAIDSFRWPIEKDEPAGGVWSYRVGKHVAGRVLDGRMWDQFPETTN